MREEERVKHFESNCRKRGGTKRNPGEPGKRVKDTLSLTKMEGVKLLGDQRKENLGGHSEPKKAGRKGQENHHQNSKLLTKKWAT